MLAVIAGGATTASVYELRSAPVEVRAPLSIRPDRQSAKIR